MPLAIPPELKKITPYVRRAEELDRDKANPESRLVAYYCRQYAVHNGIALATSPEGKTALGGILNDLEGEKEAMSAFTKEEAKFLCRKFADKIFDKADAEDRAAAATKGTARTFYAAASFLEMLQQFYKDDDESEEVAEIKKRSVYSKWKATEILKAIKEGREPTPGGYGENLETEEEEKEAGGSSESAPQVETVTDKDEEEGEEDAQPEPESGRIYVPPMEEEEEEEEQGMEIELGPPPPAYPGPSAPPPPESAPESAPKVTFTPPPMPAAEPEILMPPPPTAMPVPPPEPEPKKKSGGFFGMGKKKKKSSKVEIADAMELTRFALAALEDKNTDLAAERLQKALKVLGR